MSAPQTKDRYNQLIHQIESARQRFNSPVGSVQLLAVSKARSASEVREMALLGQLRYGENYLQEALQKIDDLQDISIEWHFIGPIQSNKSRAIAENFSWVHSVDRLKIAQRLHDQRPAGMAPLNICIQVNVSGEESKSGCSLDELSELATHIARLPNICLRGLMAIPHSSDSFEQQRIPFAQMRIARERLNSEGFKLDTLSMGMSGDLDAAIAEGATMVRIGTALFGPRDYS